MTVAVIITIIASFLWGISNHIDKFLINGVNESGRSIKTLLVFSTLIAGLVFSPIWLIISNFSVTINLISLIAIFLSSFIFILATYFYLKALDKNDASIVVVMFQMIPVFSYFLALILFKENLTIKQIIGSLIIIFSAIIISIDFEKKNNNKKFNALLLMTLSSLLYSIYFILFDFAVRHDSYNSCAFWYQIGFLIMGIVLICIKSYRTTFIKAIKENGKMYFSINAVNEFITIIANMLVHFANITIPIALVNVLDGFQGGFVFVLGALGVKFLPKYFKEDLSKKVVLQKISCIILSIVGLFVLFI